MRLLPLLISQMSYTDLYVGFLPVSFMVQHSGSLQRSVALLWGSDSAPTQGRGAAAPGATRWWFSVAMSTSPSPLTLTLGFQAFAPCHPPVKTVSCATNLEAKRGRRSGTTLLMTNLAVIP